MSVIKVKLTQFTGTSKVFSRDPDGLAAILRGMLIDNARLKIEVAGVHDFTDNSGGTPSPIMLTLPTLAIDATTTGGAQTTALNASLVKVQNAGKVITNTINEARTLLGLPLVVSASGAQVTADTIPAQDLTSTAANGATAASFSSAVAAFKQVAFNMQALVNGADEVIAAIAPIASPMFRAYNEYGTYVGNITLGAIPAVTSVAVGVLKQGPDGSTSYQGTTNALITTSFTGTTEADIIIGNGAVSAQNAFDASEQALVTAAGMAWLAAGLGECALYLSFAGNFFFMTTKWRLKALNVSSANAAMQGLAISTDGTPVNAVNGAVTIFSNNTSAQLAAAVWAYVLNDTNTAGTDLAAIRANLTTVNGGVQQASLLVPYTTNVT